MNEKETEILMEINRRMVNIQIEKEKQYQTTWQICDLLFLKAKLAQQVNKLFLPSFYNNELRILTHIFNYAFFLYYRYKNELTNFPKTI